MFEAAHTMMVIFYHFLTQIINMMVLSQFARDQKFSSLDVEIAAEAKTRRKETELMKDHVSNAFVDVKASIEDCNQERVRATGELMKAIVHYAAALQDGVNIVSTG